MRGKNAGFKGVKVKCGNAAVWEIQRRCECEKDLQDVMLINVCAFPFFLFFFNYILFLLLLCCCCCYIFEITTTNGADWFVNLTQWINPWICIYLQYIHKCVSVCVYMYYNFSFFSANKTLYFSVFTVNFYKLFGEWAPKARRSRVWKKRRLPCCTHWRQVFIS